MVKLKINGSIREVESSPEVPAIFVLRNVLDLKSVKLGCGLEQCGSCAVLMDGEVALTCSQPINNLEGHAIETIEEMQSSVQKALLQANATQCGYCLSGIIIAAEALFRRNPHPDRSAIVKALELQLCRCGSHPRVIRALMGLSNE